MILTLTLVSVLVSGIISVFVLKPEYDPVAMDNFQRHHSELPVEFARNVEALFKDSDAVVLLTEWEIFKYLPYATLGELMKQKILLDGRNALDAQALQRAGYIYRGVGR